VDFSQRLVLRRLTSLVLLDLIGLELYPCVIAKLVGEDSTEENLCNRTAEALIKAHLDVSASPN